MSESRPTFRPLRRWTALAAAASAALPLLAVTEGTAHAAESATCVTSARTYVTSTAGDLFQYRMSTPLTGAAFGSLSKAGAGWGGYGKVLAGPGGEFYSFKADGTYYSHRMPDGTWDVAPKRISDALGWLASAANRDQATVDRNGWLWVADNLGQLYAYRYDPSVGTGGGLRSMKVLDEGWNRYDLITAGDAGVLYGRATDGRLYRSQFDMASQRWLVRHVLVGSAAWGNFKTITGGGGDTLVAVQPTGEALYYRYDENTKKWPVLAKQVAASNWQNYPQVFSEPNNCKLTANHTPASPAVIPEPHSAMAAVQVAGKVDYVFSDNSGRLMHGRVDPADVSNAQLTRLPSNEAFVGKPSLLALPDERIVVTGHTSTGSVHQLTQIAKGGADWTAWDDLGGAMAQHPVDTAGPSGRRFQFATDAQGRPWHRAQTEARTNTKGWVQLAGSGFSGAFTAVTVRDGIQLFGKNVGGELLTALFKEDGTLSVWSAVGTQKIIGTPAVTVYPGFRLRITATDGTGKVVTTVQSVGGGAFGAWSTIDGITAQGSPSVVVAPLSGITEILVRGTDNLIHSTGEVTQGGSTWRPWNPASATESATDPTALAFSEASGETWGFLFRDESQRAHLVRAQKPAVPSASGSGPVQAPTFVTRELPGVPASE